MRLLALSGSLRRISSNTAALQAAAMLAPPGVEVVLFEGLAALPAFNADLDGEDAPEPVRAWRKSIGECDGLLISSPEYARGLAGSLKNALDWLVGSHEFPGKPALVINASPRARHADAQLREVLTTMAAKLYGDASTAAPLLGRNLQADAIAADAALSGILRQALDGFVETIRQAQIG